MNIWIVEEFSDVVDSVWDTFEAAQTRAIELDTKNNGEFSNITCYELNKKDGVRV